MSPVQVSYVPQEFRVPRVGDIFEINLSDNPDSPNWVRFWNNPIRDVQEALNALEIIKSRGLNVIYSSPKYARDFRVVLPMQREKWTLL